MRHSVRQVVLEKTPRPLDGLPVPWAAYGFRKLSSYSGSTLFKFRRSSGSPTTSDFSAKAGSDNLDDEAVNAWLAGAIPTVDTWYDQIQGKNALQATTGSQPGVVLNGADGYISFASGKFLNLTNLLDVARYRDGVTFAITALLPSTPDATRTLFGVSRGNGANNNRVGLRAGVTNNVASQVSPFDDITTGYLSSNIIVPLSTWWTSVVIVDNRNGINYTTLGSNILTTVLKDANKFENTASTGGRLNGHSTDTGTALYVKNFVVWDSALTLAQAAYIQDALQRTTSGTRAIRTPPVQLSPTFTGIAPPEAFFGDSQFSNSAVSPIYRLPTLASEMMLARVGTYRPARNFGVDGQTSAQIASRANAYVVTTGQIVPIIAGQNDGISTSTANHASAMLNIQSAYDHVVSGGGIPIVWTVPRASTDTTGTSGYTNNNTFNTLIKNAFPNNYYDDAEWLATAPVSAGSSTPNTSGATPAYMTYDGFHRNEIGINREAVGYDARKVALGYG